MPNNIYQNPVADSLFSSGALRVLICYVIGAVGEPVPGTELAQILHYDEIANYFDVQNTLTELEQKGILLQDKNGLLTVSVEGVRLSDTLKEELTVAVRKKAYNSVVKMLARYKYSKDTSVKIEHNSDGCMLTYSVPGKESDLLSLSIQLPNEAQALSLKEKINEDPKFYADAIIRLFTDNK